MNKEKLKGIIIGIVLSIIVLIVPMNTYAASVNKAIDVIYNNIKLVIDGKNIEFGKDSVGNQIEPFIHNGTTYLPVRAVGESLGMNVSWDGLTQTVYLGEKPGQISYLTEILQPYLIYNGYENTANGIYKSNDGRSFSMGGTKYDNGYRLGKYRGNLNFNLDGKYELITGELGVISPVESVNGQNTVSIFLDGQFYKKYTINGEDLSFNIEIPVKGVLQLKIEMDNTTGSNSIGFGNVIIK